MSTEAVEKFVQTGRELFADCLGTTGQTFGEITWDITTLASRLTGTRRILLHFTRYGNAGEPLPEPYADVVKAWLLATRKSSAENLKVNLLGVRICFEAIAQRRQNGAIDFNWDTLCEADLNQAELYMRQHWATSTTHKFMSRLQHFCSFLSAHGICQPIHYVVQTPRPRDFNNHTLAGQEIRRAKLPSQRVLDGLAEIYAHLATDPQDRLRIAAVALLVVTGFRISELLTLPLDCEVRERNKAVDRYGIRYHRGKAGGGKRALAVRWLSIIQAELAENAVSEIRDLTADARARARILEANPNGLPIPGHENDEVVTFSELAPILGLNGKYLPRALKKLVFERTNNDYLFRVKELEQHFLQSRQQLEVIKTGPKSAQLVSETLLISYKNCSGGQPSHNRLYVESLLISTVNKFVAGGSARPSIFERFNLREQDGTYCRVTTHQFRHWLNDLADKGGMPIETLTRWMGREDERDTQYYRHASVDERLAWLKENIRDGSVTGFVSDVYLDLPEAERDQFLEGQIHAVHFTPIGLCVHDFAVEPCPYHLNCLRGCHHYLRTKGDERERQELIRVRDITVRSLEQAQSLSAQYPAEIAEPWIRHHQDTLRGAEAALAVDDDASVQRGDMVRLVKLGEGHSGQTQQT